MNLLLLADDHAQRVSLWPRERARLWTQQSLFSAPQFLSHHTSNIPVAPGPYVLRSEKGQGPYIHGELPGSTSSLGSGRINAVLQPQQESQQPLMVTMETLHGEEQDRPNVDGEPEFPR